MKIMPMQSPIQLRPSPSPTQSSIKPLPSAPQQQLKPTATSFSDVVNAKPVPGAGGGYCGNGSGSGAIPKIGDHTFTADFDGSGFIDFEDYSQFVKSLESGQKSADWNKDGKFDAMDLELFVKEFENPTRPIVQQNALSRYKSIEKDLPLFSTES